MISVSNKPVGCRNKVTIQIEGLSSHYEPDKIFTDFLEYCCLLIALGNTWKLNQEALSGLAECLMVAVNEHYKIFGKGENL